MLERAVQQNAYHRYLGVMSKRTQSEVDIVEGNEQSKEETNKQTNEETEIDVQIDIKNGI